MNSRLALGTVQFGLAYGIANQAGRVSRDDANEILDYAWAVGLDTLDTAIAYGECEQRLGEIGIDEWQVISKLPGMPETCTDVTKWVHESIMGSLARLGVSKLHGLLLHRPQELLGSQGAELYQALIDLKDQGKVEKIGVSIYDPYELDALWPHYRIDLVQAPFNIIDRRLSTSGWLSQLHQAGTEIHVRSIFLQGLLLMEAEQRPLAFKRWQELWDQWHYWLVDQAITPLQACLGFVMSQHEINRVVVGVDNIKQLQEIVAATNLSPVEFPNKFESVDLNLINPSKWRNI